MKTIHAPNIDFRTREYQQSAWKALTDSSVKNVAMVWHRQSGKDELVGHSTAKNIWTDPGNYWHCFPKQSQARKAIWDSRNPATGKRRIFEFFDKNGIIFEKGRHKVNDTEMMIEFVNGSTWQLIGADKYDNIVGASPKQIVFSEAALISPEAFAFFDPMIRVNKSKAIYISTPRGKNHFYKMYSVVDEKYRSGNESYFSSFLTVDDTHVLPSKDLDDILDMYTNVYGNSIGKMLFEQEYYCKWESQSMNCIFAEELTEMVNDNRYNEFIEYLPDYPVVTAWDLGIADLTVVIFAQIVGTSVHIIDCYASNSKGFAHYAEILKNKPYYYSYHYGPHDIANRELSTGIERANYAANLGIHFQRIPKTDKTTQIANCSQVFKRIKMNKTTCDTLYKQLSDYKFKQNNVFAAVTPIPEHNEASHYADALLTLCLAVKHYEFGKSDYFDVDKFTTKKETKSFIDGASPWI